MPKIDTTKIAGYDKMSPEEKIAALEAIEYDDGTAEIERYKNAATKANSEAAEWKKKHNALLSEEEQKKNAESEELETLRAKVAEMEKEKVIAGHKAQYLAMGYEESLADATAKALASGDTEKVFANQKKFIETHDKNFKAELLKGTPKPKPGEGSDAMTLDKFRKLSPQERYDFSVKNPEQYKSLYSETGGNE